MSDVYINIPGSESIGGVSDVTASGPLASSGGATPNISLTGIVPVANGGTGSSSFTAGSVIFSNGTILTQDNPNFFWDDSLNRLRLGNPAAHGGSDITLNTALNVTDPAGELSVDHYSEASLHLTANTTTSLYNHYTTNKVLIDDTISAGGGNINFGGFIDRTDATDLGTSGVLAGSYNYMTQDGGAKISPMYISYLAGSNSVFTGTVGIMADFYALSSTLSPGTVTNRYGIYIEPDVGYTKGNWLSGKTLLGGTSYSTPSTTVEIIGDLLVTDTLANDTAGTAITDTIISNTTVDGSIDTNGIQNNVTAKVQVGATNSKAMNGVQNFVTRGDGTDQGTLSGMIGVSNVMQNNSDPAGVTALVAGVLNLIQPISGTITDLYEFVAFRSGGGTVTNHYGIYLNHDSATPIKSWLSGSTTFGGSSFTSPATNANILLNEGHLQSIQATAPTIAADAGAGTGATASLARATDIAGEITINTGTIGLSTGSYATITFDKTYTTAPIVVLTPAGSTLSTSVYVTATTADFSVNFAIAGGITSTYVLNYHVIETE